MSPEQRVQFNRMRAALIRISKEYQTPGKLRRTSQKLYGLDFEEALEYAYENIQGLAKVAVDGVREVKDKP